MPDTFHVTFGIPHHGWLPVTLGTDLTTIEFVASAIPHDPLADLAACLTVLLTTEGGRCMTWSTEPVEYEWRFHAAGPEATCTIIRYPDQQRTLTYETTLLTLVTSRVRLVQPFWRALRRLHTQADVAGHWPHPFPATAVHHLTQTLAAARAR